MASFVIVPDGTSLPLQWSYNDTDHVTSVASDDTASYISESTLNHGILFTMAPPGVLESAIDFDEDVTVTSKIRAHYTHTSGALICRVEHAGTGISVTAANPLIAVDASYPTYDGTAATEYSSGNAWTFAKLQDLELRLTLKTRPARFKEIRVSYAYFRVAYTEATEEVTVTHNAPFFGSNF